MNDDTMRALVLRSLNEIAPDADLERLRDDADFRAALDLDSLLCALGLDPEEVRKADPAARARLETAWGAAAGPDGALSLFVTQNGDIELRVPRKRSPAHWRRGLTFFAWRGGPCPRVAVDWRGREIPDRDVSQLTTLDGAVAYLTGAPAS